MLVFLQELSGIKEIKEENVVIEESDEDSPSMENR